MFQHPIFALLPIIIATSSCTLLAEETLDLRSLRSLETDPRLKRNGDRLTIRVKNNACKSVLIPRVYASLRQVIWKGAGSSEKLTVYSEPDHWVIRWTKAPTGAKAIELQFDTRPELGDEVDVIGQRGDGRLDLHAYQANTIGEKLRFEPQVHKNTVGYWVNSKDFATWTILVKRPGRFNVGILQGCGAGAGGSVASLSIRNGAQTVEQLEFAVEETGHFQNFVWRTVGVIEIPQAGRHTVRLQPKKIKKIALMDIRQIQLVRMP